MIAAERAKVSNDALHSARAQVLSDVVHPIAVRDVGHIARHRYPQHLTHAAFPRPAESRQPILPFRNRDVRAVRGSRREPVHDEMYERGNVTAPALPPRELESHFVTVDVEAARPLAEEEER